mgnify:CR=1 FL=1
MLSTLISIPLLSLIAVLQTTVVSRMPLIQGQADLMMVVVIAWALQERVTEPWQWAVAGGLVMDFLSGLPFGVFTASYLLLAGAARLVGRRLWQFSALVQLILTLLGTMVIHTITTLIILIQGTSLIMLDVLRSITLPSLLLNMIITIPAYIIVSDFAKQLYPEEIEL